MATQPSRKQIEDLAARALVEDLGSGDVTTDAIVRDELDCRARITAKEPLVLCGLELVEAVFTSLDPDAAVDRRGHADGDALPAGTDIAEVTAGCAVLLKGERVALNLLQRLSGIATLTRKFVERAGGIAVLDTRKTTPGLRLFEKYAVACGGGQNHRFGLYDAVLIKDNHIKAAGGITEAVRRVRARGGSTGGIEVEVTHLKEVEEALAAGADTLLLDNMDTPAIREAVALIHGRARVEVSGSISLDRLDELRNTGIDCVSVGALTHSARAVDISMNLHLSV